MIFIVHEEPVFRDKSNYIARVDLAPFGLDGEIEQVWLRKLDTDGSFELCCIPFRVYGLALEDVVRISGDGTTVTGLLSSSGRRVLRILVAPGIEAVKSVELIKIEVQALGLLSEWSGERHVAIDVPQLASIENLYTVVGNMVSRSIASWEWNDAIPFSV